MKVMLLPADPAEPTSKLEVTSFDEIIKLVGGHTVPVPRVIVPDAQFTIFCDEAGIPRQLPWNPHCEGLRGNVVLAPLDWDAQLQAHKADIH